MFRPSDSTADKRDLKPELNMCLIFKRLRLTYFACESSKHLRTFSLRLLQLSAEVHLQLCCKKKKIHFKVIERSRTVTQLCRGFGGFSWK